MQSRSWSRFHSFNGVGRTWVRDEAVAALAELGGEGGTRITLMAGGTTVEVHVQDSIEHVIDRVATE